MRSIAVAAALALRAIVVVARYEPPPAEDVRWGVVQRLETFGVLTIGGCFKGNECRPSACLPDEQRPPECRSTRRYE